MGMRLLVCHDEPLALEVEMVDVGNPRPRCSALGREAVFAVPSRELPVRVGILDVLLRQRLVEMGVDRRVLVARVVTPARRVVERIHLDG